MTAIVAAVVRSGVRLFRQRCAGVVGDVGAYVTGRRGPSVATL
jgi:hypothetical protein